MQTTLAAPAADSPVIQKQKARFGSLRAEAQELSALNEEAHRHGFAPHRDLKQQIEANNEKLCHAKRQLLTARLALLEPRRAFVAALLAHL